MQKSKQSRNVDAKNRESRLIENSINRYTTRIKQQQFLMFISSLSYRNGIQSGEKVA